MSEGFGQPMPGDPENHDVPSWWLDEDASRASRPSDVTQKLERLRSDVAGAPDLSARILGQAGRQEIFVPRKTRRALRLARWGAAAAACLLFAGTVTLITRTPIGQQMRGHESPVADLVAEITHDAGAITESVRSLPERAELASRARDAFSQLRIAKAPQQPAGAIAISAPVQTAEDVAGAFCVDDQSVAGVNACTGTMRLTARANRLPAPGFGPAPLLGTGGFSDSFASLTTDFRASAWAYLQSPSFAMPQATIRVGYDPGMAGVGYFDGQ